MRYSTEPKFRKYVEVYSFLSFAKKNYLVNMVKNNGYCSNNRNRCSKNCFKRIVKKTPEATGNLTGNKIAVKITSVGKSKEKNKECNRTLHSTRN